MTRLLCVLFLLIGINVGLAVGLSVGIVFFVLIMIVVELLLFGLCYVCCKKRQTVQTQVVATTPRSDGVSTVVTTPPSDRVSTAVTTPPSDRVSTVVTLSQDTAFTTAAPHTTQQTQYKDAEFSSQVAPPSYDASTAYPSYIHVPPTLQPQVY